MDMAFLPATDSESDIDDDFVESEGDYDFVEKPSEDFYCPVTFDLLREPHLTPCCGNHLSQEASTRLQGQPCPVCKEPNLITVLNKNFKRKVNELKVRCPNKSLGCEWVGRLGSLDQHLRQSSVEGECQFVTVACPYSCGDDFQRCHLKGHMMYDCPSRPCTCQYCDYEATYTEVTTEHWPVCERYPLQCPNECGGGVIERQDLEEHLDEDCPLQVVKCEFSYAGCEVKCQRQNMQDHVNENMKTHLSMVSIEQAQQNSTIIELKRTVQQQQKQIVALMSALTRVARAVRRPLAPVFVPPPDIVMTDFEEHRKVDDIWFSPPFYTHIGGYKMCLSVYANGFGNGECTHVSVFCSLMRGEYDDQLKWPFRGDITIQLLNQRRDERHRKKIVHFNDGVDDDIAGRVVGQERASHCLGYHKFIAHNELNTEDKENDCLKFRVTKAVIKSI